MQKEFLIEKCKEIKSSALEMCIAAGKGHVTSAFSCAEIVIVLYYAIMRYEVKDPFWEKRDRFIMSKNHGSVITYPILADLGYINKDELKTFMKDGSRLGGHSKRNVPGVEFSGGALGIGLGIACGLAYAAKINQETWLTFAIVGDGECYEGSIWESVLFAGHNNLNNLIVFLDRNYMCITDYTENMLALEPMEDKWKAFNWDVKRIDGHCIEEILISVAGVRSRRSNRPLCIICDTKKGNGIDFMCEMLLMHGIAPSGEAAEWARAQIERE